MCVIRSTDPNNFFKEWSLWLSCGCHCGMEKQKWKYSIRNMLNFNAFHAKNPILWPTVEDAEIQIYISPKHIIERERKKQYVISTRSGVAHRMRSAAKLQTGRVMFISRQQSKNIQSPNRQKFTLVNKVDLISLTFSVWKIWANGKRKCHMLL